MRFLKNMSIKNESQKILPVRFSMSDKLKDSDLCLSLFYEKICFYQKAT